VFLKRQPDWTPGAGGELLSDDGHRGLQVVGVDASNRKAGASDLETPILSAK
jgi:hypothetical protein